MGRQHAPEWGSQSSGMGGQFNPEYTCNAIKNFTDNYGTIYLKDLLNDFYCEYIEFLNMIEEQITWVKPEYIKVILIEKPIKYLTFESTLTNEQITNLCLGLKNGYIDSITSLEAFKLIFVTRK